jgi:nitrogen fixation protein
MAQKPKDVQQKLRELVSSAVNQNVVTPQSVKDYLIDNGWEYDLPTLPTIEKLLKANKVEYVKGYWVRV